MENIVKSLDRIENLLLETQSLLIKSNPSKSQKNCDVGDHIVITIPSTGFKTRCVIVEKSEI